MSVLGSLDDPEEKLARAWWHYQQLEASMEGFLASKPATLVGAVEDGGTKYRARYRVVANPLTTWGPMIGDCVHNLRSCLDHLIYQLTLRHNGAALDDTFFPIIEPAVAFSEKSHNMSTRGMWPIRGIHPGAQKVVETLQPYHAKEGPRRDALWLLNRLWNIDKHRLLHLAVVYPATVGISSSFPLGENPQSLTEYMFPGPYNDGDVVLEVDLPAGQAPPTNPLVTSQLVFDEERSPEIAGPVTDTLKILCDYIQNWVFPQFLPFFK